MSVEFLVWQTIKSLEDPPDPVRLYSRPCRVGLFQCYLRVWPLFQDVITIPKVVLSGVSDKGLMSPSRSLTLAGLELHLWAPCTLRCLCSALSSTAATLCQPHSLPCACLAHRPRTWGKSPSKSLPLRPFAAPLRCPTNLSRLRSPTLWHLSASSVQWDGCFDLPHIPGLWLGQDARRAPQAPFLSGPHPCAACCSTPEESCLVFFPASQLSNLPWECSKSDASYSIRDRASHTISYLQMFDIKVLVYTD